MEFNSVQVKVDNSVPEGLKLCSKSDFKQRLVNAVGKKEVDLSVPGPLHVHRIPQSVYPMYNLLVDCTNHQ